MRIDIPDNKRLVYQMSLPVRWGDLDLLGHVNSVVYFRYLETVRVEWMREVGCLPNPKGDGLVIVNAFCNFYIQLEYPCDVIAKMYVANLGRSSFDKFITLEPMDKPGKVYAAGGATAVWVNYANQRSVALPEWLRQQIELPTP